MALNFQELVFNLQKFWSDYGCIIQQPYDIEKGASTMNPATFLRSLGPEPWNTAMIEPCRRPTDARYGENPNRLGHYFQFQVILKPSPDNAQELYLKSLEAMGIDLKEHDVRLGISNFGCSWCRLGSLARWNGSYSIYIFPTSWWCRG